MIYYNHESHRKGNSLGPPINAEANSELIDAVKEGRLHAAVKALSHGYP